MSDFDLLIEIRGVVSIPVETVSFIRNCDWPSFSCHFWKGARSMCKYFFVSQFDKMNPEEGDLSSRVFVFEKYVDEIFVYRIRLQAENQLMTFQHCTSSDFEGQTCDNAQFDLTHCLRISV